MVVFNRFTQYTLPGRLGGRWSWRCGGGRRLRSWLLRRLVRQHRTKRSLTFLTLTNLKVQNEFFLPGTIRELAPGGSSVMAGAVGSLPPAIDREVLSGLLDHQLQRLARGTPSWITGRKRKDHPRPDAGQVAAGPEGADSRRYGENAAVTTARFAKRADASGITTVATINLDAPQAAATAVVDPGEVGEIMQPERAVPLPTVTGGGGPSIQRDWTVSVQV